MDDDKQSVGNKTMQIFLVLIAELYFCFAPLTSSCERYLKKTTKELKEKLGVHHTGLSLHFGLFGEDF